ncbi:MAG: phosphotransferase family protein [Myxococcaceae bacterium]
MDLERRIDARLAHWGLVREDDSPLTPAASKNRTIICRHGRARRVLVKIADGPPAHSGVVREGEVLSRLTPLTAGGACPLSLPRLFAFDRALGLVAVEWLAPSETLHSYHRRTRRYGASLARGLGRAVGFLHRVSRERAEALGPRAELTDEADLLECFLRMRPDFYSRLSLPGVELFSSVQADPGAITGLQRLSEPGGPEREVLLHGDLKQANLLRVTRRGGPPLVLLDWELSAWGDPARDLGGLVADYALGALAPERANEELEPSSLRRTLRALLTAYADERGEHFAFDEAVEQRVARWAGAALLFYVYGMTHYEGELSERGRGLIAHGVHMLAEPAQWPSLLWGTA